MSDQSKEMTIIMQCCECGSTNVRRDAWAVWDVDNQQWELGTIFDAGHCEDCEHEASLKEVMI